MPLRLVIKRDYPHREYDLAILLSLEFVIFSSNNSLSPVIS